MKNYLFDGHVVLNDEGKKFFFNGLIHFAILFLVISDSRGH